MKSIWLVSAVQNEVGADCEELPWKLLEKVGASGQTAPEAVKKTKTKQKNKHVDLVKKQRP
ncbi:hypothetical protein OUZ56_004245 [Daphnia magna]|uniref:Uncharacterized protein n=1 Tax=Daphnia magna TaxID=35525 RepID=A0ABQ9YP60_9CRUS|nr:hypothetical protein OUZ56_004245 [Daphnia magna]